MCVYIKVSLNIHTVYEACLWVTHNLQPNNREACHLMKAHSSPSFVMLTSAFTISSYFLWCLHISNTEQRTENVLKWTELSHIKEIVPSKYHDPIIGTTVLHNCLSKHTVRKNCFLYPLWIFFYLVRNKKSLITFCLPVCNFWYANTPVVLQCWYMHYSHIQ